jgi:hypothetical protein
LGSGSSNLELLFTTGFITFVESEMLLAQARFLSAQPVPRGKPWQRALDTVGPAKSALPRATADTLGKDVSRAPMALGKATARGHAVRFGPTYLPRATWQALDKENHYPESCVLALDTTVTRVDHVSSGTHTCAESH